MTPFCLSVVLIVLRAGNAMGGACPVQDGQSCYSAYVVGDGHNFATAYCAWSFWLVQAIADFRAQLKSPHSRFIPRLLSPLLPPRPLLPPPQVAQQRLHARRLTSRLLVTPVIHSTISITL